MSDSKSLVDELRNKVYNREVGCSHESCRLLEELSNDVDAYLRTHPKFRELMELPKRKGFIAIPGCDTEQNIASVIVSMSEDLQRFLRIALYSKAAEGMGIDLEKLGVDIERLASEDSSRGYL